MLDLIDRKALMRADRESSFVSIYDLIREAPRVDAKPVVHGEWDFIGDYDCRCSVCGEEYCIGPNEDYNYCPCCGAKMDGEREEA